MKTIQRKLIKNELEKKGYVTRNWALKHFISRLSSHIHFLKSKNWKFTTGFEGNDYIYYLVTKPDEKK